MPVTRPTVAQVRALADDLGFTLSDADAQSFLGLMAGTFAAYDAVAAMPDHVPAVRYPRTPGYRPEGAENRYNAWYVKTTVKGAQTGKLAGKTIVLKDNVCLAGVPMMNGASTLEGYVPDVDATIVTRMLDAGGTIVGKAHCEYFCFSGGSHTCAAGPVHNPRKPGYSAGGSSSGSAALVAAGEVDLAIGGDQGGSIRIPACWCGIAGHKPTYGLVPYTGVFPIELTLDHTGPMARTVADVAVFLEAIAGPDGLDPRQRDVRTDTYSEAIKGSVSGLRLAIVKEGFGWEGASEKDVDQMVQDAAHKLERAGAKVTTISLPMHRDGIHIWNAIAVEGATMLMVRGNSMGTNWKGHYTTSLLDVYARGWQSRANDLSETTKLVVMLGQYMQDNYHGRYYAKAQNLARSLRAAYDAALQQADLLVMPTLPMKATPIPPLTASREEYVARALEMIPNTCPFDVTGHPALTVPCGTSSGLPVGMMLIGRHWEDGTVLRAGHAFEQMK